MGSCTAGGAYVPAMSDETVIVRGTGTIFLGGPPLVKAATGEDVTRRGARRRPRSTPGQSGVADHEALDDEHALALGRSIVPQPDPARARAAVGPPRARAAGGRARAATTGAASLYAVGLADPRRPVAVREVIARLVDGSRASTSSSRCYGETLVCGLRPPRRLPGRDPGQRRDPVQPVGAQGRPLHRARLPAPDPARLPPEHHRVHGRARVRGRPGSPRTARSW